MSNEEKLNSFIESCKKEKEFVKQLNFKNSIIIHFEKTIYSNLLDDLKKLQNKVMIYHCNDPLTDQINTCLFIYKINNYEFD